MPVSPGRMETLVMFPQGLLKMTQVRPKSAVLCAWILFIVSGFLFLPEEACSQSIPDTLWLEMDDGVHLDATRFTPVAALPPGGFPAIVFVHGFGGSKSDVEPIAELYAESGYVTLAYSVRGQGASEGLSTVFSFRERQDLAHIIDYLGSQPNVNADLLGVAGASQGGFHSWFAAVDHMNVRAVAPANSIPIRSSAAARYGCYATAIATEIDPSPEVRLDTLAFPLKRLLRADEYDSVCAVLAGGRDFDSTDVAAAHARFLMMGAWHDHVFWHNRVPGAFAVAPHRSLLYLGVGGHGSGDVPEESGFRDDLQRRFFAEELKGEDHGLDDVGPAVIALGPDWEHLELDAFPQAGQQLLTYYLHADGAMSQAVPSATDPPRRLKHELTDPSYTWLAAVDDHFRSVPNAFVQEHRRWRTPPLSEPMLILGIPTACVFAKGTASRFQINFQLYDEDPGGGLMYLAHTSLGQRTNPDSSLWQRLSGEFTILGWRIAVGHRLCLDWTSYNFDVSDSTVWTVPYWNADGSLLLGQDMAHPTLINVPIVSITKAPDGPGGNSPPHEKTLYFYRNAPNPFSECTLVEFILTRRQHIMVRVFDMLGREVATLLDEELDRGHHCLPLTGRGLSSGIYCCRLQGESQAITRRLVMVR